MRIHKRVPEKQDRITKPRAHRREKMFFILPVLLLWSSIYLAGYFLASPYWQVSRRISTLAANHYNRLLASEFVIRRGIEISESQLFKRLEYRGYVRLEQPDKSRKSFSVTGNQILLTRDAEIYHLHIDEKDRITRLTAESGREVAAVALSPIALVHFTSSLTEVRYPLNYEQFPPALIRAVLQAEDRRFFSHQGIDLRGILRAALVNMQKGKISQGGSTITQQVVKMMLNRSERSFSEKIREIPLAIAVDLRFSKKDILTVYLNNVHMGDRNGFQIKGMAAASYAYFNKSLTNCSVYEYAMLAGMISSPNGRSPRRHPVRAAARAETVLQRMGPGAGMPVAGSQWNDRDGITDTWFDPRIFSSVLSLLNTELERRRLWPSNGVVFDYHLSLDPFLQEHCVAQLDRGLSDLEKKYKMKPGSLEGAVVMIDPLTGGIKAITGGRQPTPGQLNRAFQIKRQIGSLVKPILYNTVLGGTTLQPLLSQADVVRDSPIRIDYNRKSWKPKNYDRRFHGMVTIRRALAASYNIPAVKIGMKTGIKEVVQQIQLVGIEPSPAELPSLFLGAVETSPAVMASVYASYANGGKLAAQTILDSIRNRSGRIIWKRSPPRQVFNPAGVYVLTDILRAVFTEGTARALRRFKYRKISAGKTGTTSKKRDSWFAGYTSGLTGVVWVGRDNNTATGLTGASGALPIWAECMRVGIASTPASPFQVPKNIVFKYIDPVSGREVPATSSRAIRAAFIKTGLNKSRTYSNRIAGGSFASGTDSHTSGGDV